MPEAFELVDLLVGQVYAAGEGDPAVVTRIFDDPGDCGVMMKDGSEGLNTAQWVLSI